MTIIALLGASGQIGRGLIQELAIVGGYQIEAYSRRPGYVADYATRLGFTDEVVRSFHVDDFTSRPCNAVVNAIGHGDQAERLREEAAILRTTATFDDLVLDYIAEQPDTAYVFLSSGAVYGFDAVWPVGDHSISGTRPNRMQTRDFYLLAKLTAEAKHRSVDKLPIYDIRIFGYYSRLIDPDAGFLLSEITRCVLDGGVFRTTPEDFVRDYIGAHDLAALIDRLLTVRPANQALDIYSAATVGKLELIETLSRKFDMPAEFTAQDDHLRVRKPGQPTSCRRAAAIGWRPTITSLDLVVSELRGLIGP